MSSRLLNLADRFDALLIGEQFQRLTEQRDVLRDFYATRRDVSAAENAGLLLGNLMAAALYGPSGELRDKR